MEATRKPSILGVDYLEDTAGWLNAFLLAQIKINRANERVEHGRCKQS